MFLSSYTEEGRLRPPDKTVEEKTTTMTAMVSAVCFSLHITLWWLFYLPILEYAVYIKAFFIVSYIIICCPFSKDLNLVH